MRTTLWVAMMLAVTGLVRAGERPVLRGRETPRAADLLRAERMAEEIEERRRLPGSSTRSTWARGGSGWDHVGKPVAKDGSHGVTIKVVPPRKPKEPKTSARG
jgi:hypothetical protein